VMEAVVVALVAAAFGAGLTWLILDGVLTTAGASDSSVTYTINVSNTVLTTGVLTAGAIALLGALVPAIQAARTPVTIGIRKQ
ncbi:MAG: ABC transporter permease, partial [Pseudomonadota bacterium]